MTINRSEEVKPRLELQEVVPYLNLPSNNGVDVNLWDFKQRKNLVIVFHHGKACSYCREKLKELAKAYEEIQFLETEVVAVSFDNIEDLKDQKKEDALPFPLLSDKSGTTSERFTFVDKSKNAPFSSLFITDRFGALRYQKMAEEATDLPSVSEILSVLSLIQIECPECSHL